MKSTTIIILALSFMLGTASSHADVLLLDAIQEVPANNPEGIPRPTNGQSMDQVKGRYGEPKNIIPAVGDPPITRWVYDRFTVYFEHNLVINTVVHR